MNDDLALQATAGAVALGLVQAAKQAGLPARFATILSLVIATIIVVALSDTRDARAIVSGLIAGLSASGLYSGSKAVAGK